MSKRLFALLFSGLIAVTMVMTPIAQAATVEIEQNEMETTENEIKEVETTGDEISEIGIVGDNSISSETTESSNLEEENMQEITEKIETTDKTEITDKTGTTEIDGLLSEVKEEQNEIQTDLSMGQQEEDLQSTVSTQIEESSTIEINQEDTDRDTISSNVIAEGSCGENLRWTLTNDGKLCINGTGIMNPYAIDVEGNYNTPWYPYREKIKKLYFADGVETIGMQAFAKCSNLEEVFISDSVTKIGESAFYKCLGLKEVSIPASVIEIDYGAFEGCNTLSKISILNEYCDISTGPNTFGDTAIIYGYVNSTAEQYVRRCSESWGVEKIFKVLDIQPSTYIISYDANGGQNAPEPQKKDRDKPLILSDIKPTREGFIFVGWAKSAKGALRHKDAEKVKNISSVNGKTVTLYAVWQEIEP